MIYVPGGRDLEYKSLPLWAKHSSKDIPITEYDAHSLNGFYETQATNSYFKENNERTMTISRSSFTGSGKWT